MIARDTSASRKQVFCDTRKQKYRTGAASGLQGFRYAARRAFLFFVDYSTVVALGRLLKQRNWVVRKPFFKLTPQGSRPKGVLPLPPGQFVLRKVRFAKNFWPISLGFSVPVQLRCVPVLIGANQKLSVPKYAET
jgi:hypothetical protein